MTGRLALDRRDVLVRHPLRATSRIVTLLWLLQNRHDLARWGHFGLRLRSELQRRDLTEIFTEVRARMALTADPRTREAADVDITSCDHGCVVIQAPGDEPIALIAREVVARTPGVIDVRVVDRRLPTLAAALGD